MGRPKAGVPWTLPTPQGATGDIDLGGVPSASRGANEIANRSGSEPIAASGRAVVAGAAAVPAISRPRLFDAAAVPTVSLLVKFFQGINDSHQTGRRNRSQGSAEAQASIRSRWRRTPMRIGLPLFSGGQPGVPDHVAGVLE